MKQFGDFQTPMELVRAVMKTLPGGIQYTRALEPSCGSGNFIRGILEIPNPPRSITGIEIDGAHIRKARAIRPPAKIKLEFIHGSIFETGMGKVLESRDGPILVVGNPPWVTNSEMGRIRGANLPPKSNFLKLRGIDAVTGKSNFDIAGYIWIMLLDSLADRVATISLLCKTSVARKTLEYARSRRLPLSGCSIRTIDARKWFGAAAGACLFTVHLNMGPTDYSVACFDSLESETPSSTAGFLGDRLVRDIGAFRPEFFSGSSNGLRWRHGIKHDAAKVLELTLDSGRWVNGFGEVIDVEDERLYPLVKSTDVAGRGPSRRRAVIVPNRKPGEDTTLLRKTAPKLWRYLSKYRKVFEARKSSIFRGKPPFSVFGIGDYSFSPGKVVVSAMHKSPVFAAFGPVQGKPVICDGTCYILPVANVSEAARVAAVLNHQETLKIIGAAVFPDAKRVISAGLLNELDIDHLARHLDMVNITQLTRLGTSDC